MTYEVKSLNEECGVFGIWGHPDAAKLTYFGLHSLQHRGQEGAGILSNDHGQLKRHRDMGLLSEVFKNPANLDKLTGSGAIGHVRYATAGEASVDNIQPFLFRFHDMQFGLAQYGFFVWADSHCGRFVWNPPVCPCGTGFTQQFAGKPDGCIAADCLYDCSLSKYRTSRTAGRIDSPD